MKWFGPKSQPLETAYQEIAHQPLPKGCVRRVMRIVFSEEGQLARWQVLDERNPEKTPIANMSPAESQSSTMIPEQVPEPPLVLPSINPEQQSSDS